MAHGSAGWWTWVHRCDNTKRTCKVVPWPSVLCSMCRTSKTQEDHIRGLFYKLSRIKKIGQRI